MDMIYITIKIFPSYQPSPKSKDKYSMFIKETFSFRSGNQKKKN